jgi:hypothetical protein
MMHNEAIEQKRTEITHYLESHGMHDVNSHEEIHIEFRMNDQLKSYSLKVEREWLDLKSTNTIDHRLDKLRPSHFFLPMKRPGLE